MAETSGRGALRRVVTSPFVAVVIAMLFWAASTVLVRGVRDVVPPVGLSFWRTMLGALIILPFTWRTLVLQADLVRRNLGIILLLAFLLIVGGNAVLFVALNHTIAINAGVLNSFEPVLIIVVAWAVFGDPVSLSRAAGVAISLLGVLALISRGDLAVLADLEFNFGDLLVLGAYTSWAFYAVYLRKSPRELDPRAMLFLILFFGALMLLPFYALEWAFDRPTRFDLPTLATTFVLALFSSVMAVQLWNYGIRSLGAPRASVFIHLILVFTVVFAILFLGETLERYHLAGIALIGIGIYLSTMQRAQERG